VRITEELNEWKNICSGSRKSRLTAVRDPLRWPCDLLSAKMTLTSPTCGGH
jgi:hypothetical protein